MKNKTVFTLGEILMRLSTPNNQLMSQAKNFEVHTGGSEVNIAIALSNFGVPNKLISALPQNELAKSIRKSLKHQGLDTQYIKYSEKGRLGVYYVEQGAAIRGSQVIYDRDHSTFANLKRGDFDWTTIFKDGGWFHLSGISPSVSESSADLSLEAVEQAKAAGMKISIDLNYRKNLWKYGKSPVDVMPEIVQYADILLADPNTANVMLGTDLPVSSYYKEADELLEAYEKLMGYYPNLQSVSMLLRDVKSRQSHVLRGVLYEDGKMYGADPILVEPVIERIGGGDAFMTGLIFGYLEDKERNDLLKFATTLSALKMTISSDASLFDLEYVNEFIANKNFGRISR